MIRFILIAAILLVGQHIPPKKTPQYRKLWDQIIIESHRKSQQEWEELMDRINRGWDK